MKNKLLKFTTVLLGITLSSLQGQIILNVKTTSGTQTTYTLNGIRKLTFPNSGNMTVTKTTEATNNYVLNNIRYMNFSDLGTNFKTTSKLKSSLQLYPNPVLDVVNIQYRNSEKHYTIVELLSIDGKLHYKSRMNGSTHSINVSEFKQGIYLCRINDGTRIETTKFFKQ